MLDVGGACLDVVDFGGVDVEAEGVVAGICIGEDKRESHVAEADDSDGGVFWEVGNVRVQMVG